jgi:ribonuclease HI
MERPDKGNANSATGSAASSHKGRSPRAAGYLPNAAPSRSPPEVQLFTDGACSGNPGPGGWAFILRHAPSGKELERSGGEAETTNNRMELTAVVRGLESLKRRTHVEILTDSEYVRKGLSEWMRRWKANGWRRREGKQMKEVKNEDLWRRLDELTAQHEITYTRVAGHSGHPENDRCDLLAVAAYQRFRKP